MLRVGRTPMTDDEEEAFTRLLQREKAHGKVISITRAEPRESGPLRVEIDGDAWNIDGDSFRKQD